MEEIGLSRLQGYQSYKAIKATGGGCRDRFLKCTRLSRLLDGVARRTDRFFKATRLSRLLEGGTGKGVSRLQGYQGYWRGTHGYVSHGYKAIKATRP